MAGSRRRRSHAASRPRRGSTSPRCRARGPAGGSSRRTWRRPARAEPRRPGTATDPGGGDARDRQGPDQLRGADQAAGDSRAANGGVEGGRAALLPAGLDRYEPLRRGAGVDQGRRRRGRGRALLQRHGGQGCGAGAARVPPRQRRLPRWALRALLASQRRGRRRRPGRAGGADRVRRRPQGAAPDRLRDAGACGTGAGRADHAARSSPAAPSPSPTSECSGSRISPR